MSILKKIYLLLSLVVLLISCSINPKTPELSVIPVWEAPAQPLSTINVPLKINLKPYFEETDSTLPKIFKGKEKNCQGVSFSYTFERDPIVFTGENKQLNFAIDGRYALNLNYCPQCTEIFNENGNCVIPRIYTSCGVDEPMRKLKIEYTTNIKVGSDYHLKSTTKLKELKALTPCKITVFNYNATDKILTEVKNSLTDMEAEIDNDISLVSLKPEVQKIWNQLSTVNELSGYGFLHINPQNISVSDISYVDDTAFVHAQLTARPIIYLDSVENHIDSLPELIDYDEVEGFNIAADISANYDSLSSMLTKNMSKKSFEIKGREVVLDSISIYGAVNHKLSLKVNFSGKKNGTLFLSGTPRFDSLEQHISFPDLEYDIETRSAMLRSAKWLFSEKLKNKIREASDIDLRSYMDTLKNNINHRLNGELAEGIQMQGAVDALQIAVIQPLENGLFIRINSKGRLTISM